MRLGILTGGYTRHFIPDICDFIDYCADLGYQALDLSLDSSFDRFYYDDNWKMYVRRMKRKAELRNIVFSQAHSPIGGYIDSASEKSEKAMERCIEICSYLGIKSLVVHLYHIKGCTRESFVEDNANYFSRFLPLLDKYNVDFCFENLGHFKEEDLYCFTADDLLKVINRMNHKHIHACWDTGHANLTRLDQYEEITKLGDHLRAIHVHDSFYPIKEPDGYFAPDMHMPPLFGNINFDSVMQALIDINYQNAFSIETDMPNRRGHKDFFYNGELVLNLKPIPFSIRNTVDKLVCDIGFYMLEMYGLKE